MMSGSSSTGSHSSDAAAGVVAAAIAAGVFPGAVAAVGSSEGSIWAQAFGTLTFDAAVPVSIETLFDLASLTKVVATTSVAMNLVASRALRLDERVADFFPEWRGADRDGVTVADLLEHAAGLPARLVDAPPKGRREFEHDICTMPLEYAPRTRSIYSDLGFVLLGFLLADRGGVSLADQFDALWSRLAPHVADGGGDHPADPVEKGLRRLLTFDVAPSVRRLAAPTMPMLEDARRGRILRGEVHDNYAAALGGVAGHAGLFGTAPALSVFAQAVLRGLRGEATLPPPWTPERLRQFAAKSSVPGSSRALGWDTMLPTSSCGTRMSASAIGHAGFTGTSLWIDPERDRYFVLLTNRVLGAGTLEQMREVRRAFHDASADIRGTVD
jgi:CubicO group peptidase (beta-lactamase class C family)